MGADGSADSEEGKADRKANTIADVRSVWSTSTSFLSKLDDGLEDR